MFFDFCVGPPGASGAPCGLDTIFWIWGDSSYQTPHKGITPGKTYLVFTLKGEGLVRYDGRANRVAQDQALVMRPTRDFGYGCPGDTWHFWWFELCQPQSCLEEDRVLCVRAGDFVQRLFQYSLICAKQGRWDIAQSLFLPALMLLGQDVGKSGTVPEALLRAEHYIRENLTTVTVAPSARSWISRSGPCATFATARWGTAPSASSPASAWKRRSSFSPIPPCRFAQSPPCWATTIPFISAAASGNTIISRPANTGGARPPDADQTKSLAATTGSVAPPSMVSTQPVI